MAAAIELRDDLNGDELRRLARDSRDAKQVRRLLALAVIRDGGTRTEAARIGGVGLQIVRDWVLRFNAEGPSGLVDRKAPGKAPTLTAEQRAALARVVETGPEPWRDGVVRWRRIDLVQWLWEEFRVSVSEATVGRELRALGFRKLSARPRHYAQDPEAAEAFKKVSRSDAGFGNEHATYLLAKELIKAGACALQIENQVSDAKQCGHQDGKVTVPREDFIEKLRACRLAFEELGVDDGVIVARTDSLGAGLTQKVPVSQRPGDLASEYIKWLKTEPIDAPAEGELAIVRDGAFVRPVRMPNGLFAFREGTGRARVIKDCIASLNEGGADLIWIETDTPNVDEIASMVAEIRKQAPKAKLTYNNSPSFNWTLNLRRQVRAQWLEEGRITEADYPDGAGLMSADLDTSELGQEADRRLKAFQSDIAARAGVFHNLITLPTFHLTAKSMDELSRGYFGEDKMLAYVATVQREEIRRGVSAVRHQHEVGSDLGDTFKEMVSGERALKAGGHANTMNQFAAE